MMRSLGLPPYNQHTWLPAPIDPRSPNDPRYTSTPLHWTRDDAMVRLLVEHGADVNAQGTSGDFELLDWFLTPLWRAAHDGRLESVKVLVEHGADINVADPDGCNQALKTAVENGAVEVCDYLIAQGARADIHSAAMLGLVETVQEWLEKEPPWARKKDGHGRTPLDGATLMDSFRVSWPQTAAHDEVARQLVAAGAEVELAHAASLGWLDTVRRIVAADPGVLTHRRPVEALLTGGAQFESALQAARRRGREDAVRFLLERGAPEG
jgi:ankyrin repeat protein